MDPMQAQIPQMPAQVQPVPNPYNLVGQEMPVVTTPVPQMPVPPATEGILEKMIKGIVRFIAKASGNPDPFTGQPTVTAQPVPPGAVSAPQGLFGQIGGAFSGIAETAQSMAGQAISGIQAAAIPPQMIQQPQQPPQPQVPQIQPQVPVQPVVAPVPPMPPQA